MIRARVSEAMYGRVRVIAAVRADLVRLIEHLDDVVVAVAGASSSCSGSACGARSVVEPSVSLVVASLAGTVEDSAGASGALGEACLDVCAHRRVFKGRACRLARTGPVDRKRTRSVTATTT